MKNTDGTLDQPQQDRSLHPLDYARASSNLAMLTPIGILYAILGIFANIGLILLSIRNVCKAQEAYSILLANPQYYGRLISLATVAELRTPVRLWIASSLLIAASAFGLLLAIHLVLTVARERTAQGFLPASGFYARWKLLGASLTATTFFWATFENDQFWMTATRHIPVGSAPPIFSSIVLLLGAILPAVWIRRQLYAIGREDGLGIGQQLRICGH